MEPKLSHPQNHQRRHAPALNARIRHCHCPRNACRRRRRAPAPPSLPPSRSHNAQPPLAVARSSSKFTRRCTFKARARRHRAPRSRALINVRRPRPQRAPSMRRVAVVALFAALSLELVLAQRTAPRGARGLQIRNSRKFKPQVHRRRSKLSPFQIKLHGCRTTLPHREGILS